MTKKNKTTPTKDEINKIVMDASEHVLEGVQKMFDRQDEENEKKFVTKEDAENFATKQDIAFVRDDIKGLKGELSDTASRDEFDGLRSQVKRLASNQASC